MFTIEVNLLSDGWDHLAHEYVYSNFDNACAFIKSLVDDTVMVVDRSSRYELTLTISSTAQHDITEFVLKYKNG